jgi:hypothetical protein
MARVPPDTGGGEGMAYGRKGKGILIHRLTDAAGMSLPTRTTPAIGDERARVLCQLSHGCLFLCCFSLMASEAPVSNRT